MLGAGASKIFGLKTLQDLTSDLVEKMTDLGYEKTISDIVQAIKHYGLNPDFENIYTTLEGLATAKEGIRRNGGLTTYIAYKTNYIAQQAPAIIDQYKKTLSDLRELIYRECSIPKGVIERKGKIFDRLFGTIGANYQLGDHRFLTEQRSVLSVTGQAHNETVGVGAVVVTTNYDMAIELYHRSRDLKIVDGFKRTENDCYKELDFNEFGRTPNSRWLLKLHGSIWQFVKSDGQIIQTINALENLALEVSVRERMMIYPVGEKPILQYPYFPFYSMFRAQLWNVLIAIGHSFRDDPINVAILERLKNSGAKLIVINPEAETVVQNIGPLTEDIKQRIIRISQPFEDKNALFDKLGIALQCGNMTEFRRKARSLSR